MTIKGPVLITVLIALCCEIGTAQQCPIGCQSRIDALQNEVAALKVKKRDSIGCFGVKRTQNPRTKSHEECETQAAKLATRSS